MQTPNLMVTYGEKCELDFVRDLELVSGVNKVQPYVDS